MVEGSSRVQFDSLSCLYTFECMEMAPCQACSVLSQIVFNSQLKTHGVAIQDFGVLDFMISIIRWILLDFTCILTGFDNTDKSRQISKNSWALVLCRCRYCALPAPSWRASLWTKNQIWPHHLTAGALGTRSRVLRSILLLL